MWGYTYWPWGLSVAALAFLGPELYAAFTNVRNTLSWYCWHKLGIDIVFTGGIHSMAWWNSLLAWLVFVVIITAHIWWKAQL